MMAILLKVRCGGARDSQDIDDGTVDKRGMLPDVCIICKKKKISGKDCYIKHSNFRKRLLYQSHSNFRKRLLYQSHSNFRKRLLYQSHSTEKIVISIA